MHLTASAGGHVDLLDSLRDAFADCSTVWVTASPERAAALRERGKDVRILPRFDGPRWGRLRNVVRACALALRERPRLVVTSGAGSVVAFCALARLLGARLVFVETMARVTDASAAGRVLAPLSSTTLVQWPEMKRVYPRAVVCRPALWEGDQPPRATPGGGTFVAVGSHTEPFDRLLELVDDAVDRGLLPEPVCAQTGVSTYAPRNFERKPWMSREDIERCAASCRYVLCHGGSGIISTALRAGRKPLVLPRRHHLGEHVDDHQLQIAAKLTELDLVVRIDDGIDAVKLDAAGPPVYPLLAVVEAPSMEDVLREHVLRFKEDAR